MKLPVPLLLLAWAAGIAAVVSGGFVLDDYSHLKRGLATLPYPFEGVALSCLVVTVEVLLLAGVLRPLTYRASWGRALFVLGLATLLCLAHASIPHHSPAYAGRHAWWLFAVCNGLLVTTAVSAMATERRPPTGSGLRCPACGHGVHRGWLLASRAGRLACPHCRDAFSLRMRHKMAWLAALVATQAVVFAGLPLTDVPSLIVAMACLATAAIGWMALDAFEPVTTPRPA